MRSLLAIFAFLLPCVSSAGIKPFVYRGVDYRILEARPENIRLIWRDPAGTPICSFPAALRHLESKGIKPVALMNGGIYDPGFSPKGLYVENGKQLRPIDLRDGKGNFYMKPNGVFFIAADRAGVTDSVRYPPKDLKIVYAVQSGPLLLDNGRTHPTFRAKSSSRLIRNGVGVTKDGKKVVLAATDFHSSKLSNLHEFADLFRHLGCPNALFLDGDLSQLREGKDMARHSNNFSSIFVVTAPKQP